jgi:hypothetical protein
MRSSGGNLKYNTPSSAAIAIQTIPQTKRDLFMGTSLLCKLIAAVLKLVYITGGAMSSTIWYILGVVCGVYPQQNKPALVAGWH